MERSVSKSQLRGGATVVVVIFTAGCGGSVAASPGQGDAGVVTIQDAAVADLATPPISMSAPPQAGAAKHAATSLANATCALEASCSPGRVLQVFGGAEECKARLTSYWEARISAPGSLFSAAQGELCATA